MEKSWENFGSYSVPIESGSNPDWDTRLNALLRREGQKAEFCTCPEAATEKALGVSSTGEVMFWSAPKELFFFVWWASWSHQRFPQGTWGQQDCHRPYHLAHIKATSEFGTIQASMNSDPEVGQDHEYINGLSTHYRSLVSYYIWLKKFDLSRSCFTDGWCSTESVVHFSTSQTQTFNYAFYLTVLLLDFQ